MGNEIKVANSQGRDAVVGCRSVLKQIKVRWVDEAGRGVQPARVMKSTLAHDLKALEAKAGGAEKVAESLIAGDPEIDIENFGRALTSASRLYIDPDGKIVHKVKRIEVKKNPDGTERERHPAKREKPNVGGEDTEPLKWTKKTMKKAEVYNKFVFSSKRQIVHINGLTYDFLYAMAKDLEEKQCLLVVGAGKKSNEPLTLVRGGQKYRGFLEGRTQGDKYCLILHLSNLELKPAPAAAAPSAAGSGEADAPKLQT